MNNKRKLIYGSGRYLLSLSAARHMLVSSSTIGEDGPFILRYHRPLNDHRSEEDLLDHI